MTVEPMLAETLTVIAKDYEDRILVEPELLILLKEVFQKDW